jgi:hypothetical protein
MGNILYRAYAEEKKTTAKSFFMLAPPNAGSELADYLGGTLSKKIFGEAAPDLATREDSFVNRLSPYKGNATIFMGNKTVLPFASLLLKGRDDGMVSVDRAKLENCTFVLLDGVTHWSILQDRLVMKEILKKMTDE